MDIPLIAAISNLGFQDKGTIDDLEKVVAHLFMHDSVTKRKSASGNANSDNLAHVSETEVNVSSPAPGKSSKGETSVEIRHCK